VLTNAQGTMLKDEAMNRVDKHADAVWKLAALHAVAEAARTLSEFTTDAVVPLINPNATTHDLRALGPVMTRAAKLGWIEKSPMPFIPTPRRHMAPLQVWRSLLFGDDRGQLYALQELRTRQCIMSCLTWKPSASAPAP